MSNWRLIPSNSCCFEATSTFKSVTSCCNPPIPSLELFSSCSALLTASSNTTLRSLTSVSSVLICSMLSSSCILCDWRRELSSLCRVKAASAFLLSISERSTSFLNSANLISCSVFAFLAASSSSSTCANWASSFFNAVCASASLPAHSSFFWESSWISRLRFKIPLSALSWAPPVITPSGVSVSPSRVTKVQPGKPGLNRSAVRILSTITTSFKSKLTARSYFSGASTTSFIRLTTPSPEGAASIFPAFTSPSNARKEDLPDLLSLR